MGVGDKLHLRVIGRDEIDVEGEDWGNLMQKPLVFPREKRFL